MKWLVIIASTDSGVWKWQELLISGYWNHVWLNTLSVIIFALLLLTWNDYYSNFRASFNTSFNWNGLEYNFFSTIQGNTFIHFRWKCGLLLKKHTSCLNCRCWYVRLLLQGLFLATDRSHCLTYPLYPSEDIHCLKKIHDCREWERDFSDQMQNQVQIHG